MSGHSKWATTKHKKAAIDAKRGKMFAKLVKNVEVAARTGGPDPAGNPTLYDAIQKAKKSSVPNDNIDRAVKRGGGLDGGPVHAVFIRAPWVESVSPDVEVLATVPETDDAGAAAGRIVAVRQRSVLATAFHPELTGDGRVHRLFTEMVRAS